MAALPSNHDDISFDVDTSQLDRALSALSLRVQKSIVRDAMEAAGDVILDRIRTQAPERSDELPGGNSLPPGVLKADLHTQVIVKEGTVAIVRVGPSEIAGHVCRWQNNGFTLTSHGRKRNRVAIKRKNGKPNPIPGLHFMESGADEAAQPAIDRLVQRIAQGLNMDLTGYEGVGKEDSYGGENY